MIPLERAVREISAARELCLSLKRAFVGPGALARMRAGEAARPSADDLHVGLGLAWAARDLELMRSALASVSPERIAADAMLAAFDAASRSRLDRDG